ncbi:hypothetical protein J6590_059623 [Homalodisca vitripennis]|nr:hypothetical protein J6590_059623 [Homalodisca vitripennis]
MLSGCYQRIRCATPREYAAAVARRQRAGCPVNGRLVWQRADRQTAERRPRGHRGYCCKHGSRRDVAVMRTAWSPWILLHARLSTGCGRNEDRVVTVDTAACTALYGMWPTAWSPWILLHSRLSPGCGRNEDRVVTVDTAACTALAEACATGRPPRAPADLTERSRDCDRPGDLG